MLNLPGEVHFWTYKDDICIPENDFGAFRYHEKKEGIESLYLESKKSYALTRGISWTVSNKKSSPLKKEALKVLEEQLSQHRIVKCDWRRHDALQILFSSGLLVSITLNVGTTDIVKISTDKYLLGKLPSECLTDIVFGCDQVFLAFSDAVLGMVHLGRPHFPPPEKLSRQEPRFLTFDLGGPSGRRLERRLSLSSDESMLLVWWRCAQDEVYPWSPVVRDCDRANLLVYTVSGSKLELLCFYKTEGDPVGVIFSKQQSNVLFLVEQRVSRKGEVSVENSTFEVQTSNSRLVRSPTVGALQLQTQACCIARSPDETRLALGCIDGSVLLHSPSSTLLVKTAFIPSMVAWHPDGCLVVVANEKGQLQSFDLALAPVKLQLLSDEPACTASLFDLTKYFRYQPTLCFMSFNKKPILGEFNGQYAPSDGFLFMHFERGPLAVLRLVEGGGLPGSTGGLSPDALVTRYLCLGMVDCAINLLGTLSWDAQGAICLACMHRICNHLFSLQLSTVIEEQLEAVLGTFMSPSVPLSLGAENQFGRTIHHLARRFFHILLRHQRFEKAFRLAIDLGDYDLFMDLFHSAKGVRDEALAQAAKKKASEVIAADKDSTSSDSVSVICECSRSSCSECGSGSHSSSSSDSEAYLESAISKPTKVTFSDTVTHIVDTSSGDEEDGEEEDDNNEAQSLIVSDAPLRIAQSRSSFSASSHITPIYKTRLIPVASKPEYSKESTVSYDSSIPQSSMSPDSEVLMPTGATGHPEYLITNSLSFSSFSSTSNKVPLNMALYTSSSSYLAHLPGNYNLKSSSTSIPNTSSKSNARYYSVFSETTPQAYTASNLYSTTAVTNSNSTFQSPPTRNNTEISIGTISNIARNSERGSTVPSMAIPPPKVHQASITSLNPNKASPILKNNNTSTVFLNASQNSSRMKTTTLRNNSTETCANVSESVHSYSLTHSTSVIDVLTSSTNTSQSRNNFTKERMYKNQQASNVNKTHELNSSATNSTPTYKSDNSIYTVASSSTATISPIISTATSSLTPTLPLLSINGSIDSKLKRNSPLTLEPVINVKHDNGLPLHSLNSSPLYLNPFPLRDSNQRENDKLNLPLFKISSVDLRSAPFHQPKEKHSTISKSFDDLTAQNAPEPPNDALRKPRSCTNLEDQSLSLEVASTCPRTNELSGDPHTSGLPLSRKDNMLLRKFGQETAFEEEESVTSIKVVHFGIV